MKQTSQRSLLFRQNVNRTEAEGQVRALVERIERGVFWPPSPTREWQYDYADWLYPSPEESVDEAWIADQEGRLSLAV